jgi:hypothetical protein
MFYCYNFNPNRPGNVEMAIYIDPAKLGDDKFS